MSTGHYGAVIALLCALTACGEKRVEDKTPTVVVREVADTLIVDNRGDLTLRLVEETRIGRVEGDEIYTFGRIGSLTVDRDGRMYVYDAAFDELRVYDSDGTFVRRIGRRGAGPGEFSAFWGLTVLDDGRVLVRDENRVVIFSSSGEALTTWPARGSVILAAPVLVPDADGGVFVRVGAGSIRRGAFLHLRQALVHLDSAGRVIDTLQEPLPPDRDRCGRDLILVGSARFTLRDGSLPSAPMSTSSSCADIREACCGSGDQASGQPRCSRKSEPITKRCTRPGPASFRLSVIRRFLTRSPSFDLSQRTSTAAS